MSVCEKCEVLPEKLIDRGSLYLSPAIAPTETTICRNLDKLGLDYSRQDGLIEVNIDKEDLAELLSEGMNDQELEDSRALFVPEGHKPEFRDLIHMDNLLSLKTRLDEDWLIDLLQNKQITSHFQPIMYASEPDRIYGREALLRTKEGAGGKTPGVIFSTARNAGLLFYLDREARITAVATAAARGFDETLFINFNPTSIYNPEYCLQTTKNAVEKAGFSPNQIVFEIVESDYILDVDKMLSIVKYYRSNGFRVALDDLGAGYGSLNLLSKLQPDFVKLDMDLVMGVHKDSYKGVITRNLLKITRELGVKTIAEGIETEEELAWVQEAEADFVQGFLLGKPQP